MVSGHGKIFSSSFDSGHTRVTTVQSDKAYLSL